MASDSYSLTERARAEGYPSLIYMLPQGVQDLIADFVHATDWEYKYTDRTGGETGALDSFFHVMPCFGASMACPTIDMVSADLEAELNADFTFIASRPHVVSFEVNFCKKVAPGRYKSTNVASSTFSHMCRVLRDQPRLVFASIQHLVYLDSDMMKEIVGALRDRRSAIQQLSLYKNDICPWAYVDLFQSDCIGSIQIFRRGLVIDEFECARLGRAIAQTTRLSALEIAQVNDDGAHLLKSIAEGLRSNSSIVKLCLSATDCGPGSELLRDALLVNTSLESCSVQNGMILGDLCKGLWANKSLRELRCDHARVCARRTGAEEEESEATANVVTFLTTHLELRHFHAFDLAVREENASHLRGALRARERRVAGFRYFL